MEVIGSASGREHMDVLGVGEDGYVSPQLVRVANQVQAILGAEYAMHQIVCICVRHKLKPSCQRMRLSVTVRTAGRLRNFAPTGLLFKIER
jgi:hypothetical protein